MAPPTDDQYRTIATEQYVNDGLEIDAEAPISHADNGAWVQAWVWVYDPDDTADEDA